MLSQRRKNNFCVFIPLVTQNTKRQDLQKGDGGPESFNMQMDTRLDQESFTGPFFQHKRLQLSLEHLDALLLFFLKVVFISLLHCGTHLHL